jgi:serine/threonine-protein kinase
MSLAPGDKLGPYEILAPIGKGGMGQVFRARDTRLGRDVAIKTSIREFDDRFEREARAIAALNHPNICTLYDVGPDYLVMELVEGESLSTIVGRGPLPTDQAVRYATQIVDALSTAHAKGIIHRDLKPGNIIITRNGAKVLDFGLAKLTADLAKDRTPSGFTETLTQPITNAGAILGTLSYMAPEQAEGKEADERSDIFSFGIVFYEMLSGRRPFTGDTQAAVLASLLKDQPAPLTQHPSSPQSFDRIIPRPLERLVRKCLEKKPDDRWQSARDLKPALELIDLEAPTPSTSSASVAVPAPRKRWLAPAIAAGLAFLLTAGFAGYRYWQANSFTDLALVRQDVNLGPNVELMPPITFATNFAISPDGSRIAYIARPSAGGNPRLYTRRLDRANAIELPGTENPRNPFFSPDGEWLGFSSQRKLYKVSVDGGALVPLLDLTGQFLGASWNKNTIVVAQGGSPLVRIADTGGGQPTPLAPFLPGELLQASPQILPDGETVIFTTTLGNQTGLPDPNQARVEAISLRDQKRKTLQTNTNIGRYVPSRGGTGHLLYPTAGALYAVPFDPGTLEKQGAAVPLLSDMLSTANTNGKYAVSSTGILIYQKSSVESSAGALSTLQWIDAAGKAESILAESADYVSARISPDGARLAVVVHERTRHNIRVLDWHNGRTTSLTFGDADYNNPLWTPDGQHVVFSRSDGGIYFAPADGSGRPQQLVSGVAPTPKLAASFLPDGSRLAFVQQASGRQQLWTVAIRKEGNQLRAEAPVRFLESDSPDQMPRFSPDGKWLAYMSMRSDGPQIYIRPASGQGGQWVLPDAPAGYQIWSQSTQDLLYATVVAQGLTRMKAVHYATQGDTFVADKPRVWLDSVPSRPEDLSPDGKRLLLIIPQGTATGAPPAAREIVFLQNFFDELRRRAPVAK